MLRRRLNDVNYKELTHNSGFVDEQFANVSPKKIPWKAITLAGSLLIVGTVVLIIGILIVTDLINIKYSDRMWPMIMLGVLMFIPGAYHTRIAFYAYKKVPGYSFDDIPEFD